VNIIRVVTNGVVVESLVEDDSEVVVADGAAVDLLVVVA